MPSAQNPVMEPERPVHSRCDALIVRCDQCRRPFFTDQLQKFAEHNIGRRFIKIAGRFIGKDKGRAVGQGARDSNPLLLAA